MICYWYYDFPIGTLGIEENGREITRIFRRGADIPHSPCTAQTETSHLAEAAGQLKEYFSHRREAFALHIKPQGTEFQLAVWEALETIPYGEQRSYQNIADQLGRPGAARAVGAACGANPLLIVVPCHRVVASDGALGGYALGTDVKKSLLELEQKAVLRT